VAAFLGVVIVTMPLSGGAALNYDESAVVPYTLPDVLVGPDGKPAATPEDWTTWCRPHQVALLKQNVYGRRLPPASVMVAGKRERADVTLAGGLLRRHLSRQARSCRVDLLRLSDREANHANTAQIDSVSLCDRHGEPRDAGRG